MVEVVYLLVRSEPGREMEISEEFKKLHKVSVINAVTGPYDYLIKLEGENLKEIGQTIIRHLRQIHGVRDTLTLAVVDSYL